MTSISALIFQFRFFQEKMHDYLYWASKLNAPRINVLGKKMDEQKNKALCTYKNKVKMQFISSYAKKYVFWQKHASTHMLHIHIGLHVTAYSLLACHF